MLAFALSISPNAAIAGAKITFSAYEGPPVVATGTGGTRLEKHDIDYWTSGTPPRRYQIIGMVQDRRDEAWDGGNAIGSRTVAKKVKQAGGDAVIIQSEEEAGSTGGAGTGAVLGGFFAMGGSKTITKMLVVKYLPEADASTTPQHSDSATAEQPSP